MSADLLICTNTEHAQSEAPSLQLVVDNLAPNSTELKSYLCNVGEVGMAACVFSYFFSSSCGLLLLLVLQSKELVIESDH